MKWCRASQRGVALASMEDEDLSSSGAEECSFSSWSCGSDMSSDSSSESCDDGDNVSSEGYGTDSSQTPPPTILHWVRMNCLRVHDNPALNHSISNSKKRFRAVFIIDPWFACAERKFGVNRWRFLLESLHDLDRHLHQLGSRLYVARGQPVAILERLSREWNVEALTFQIDREPHSHTLEMAVEKLCEVSNIAVNTFSAHTLYDTQRVLAMNGHQPITSFRQFGRLLPSLGPPGDPVETPDISSTTRILTSDDDSDLQDYRIPTLEELGLCGESLYTNDWIGGETEALRRLPIYCHVRCQPVTNKVDILFDKTSLSPYIRFGCLSVRYFINKVKSLAQSEPAMEVLLKELTAKLLQREFYFTVASQIPNFDHYVNNPICVHLPWHDDNETFTQWKEARTGYPWIDAAMRQLKKEGWIHRYLRESVAAFLTRGDLWISWVEGHEAFEELTLDFEASVSCGCWMKSSCSAFITGPVEHFCPITFGQRIDPDGQYIRAYIPELRNYPSQYIYSPWTAPLNIQHQSGCRIGVDYPNPMVDHTTAGAICHERLRSVMAMLHQASKLLCDVPVKINGNTFPSSINSVECATTASGSAL